MHYLCTEVVTRKKRSTIMKYPITQSLLTILAFAFAILSITSCNKSKEEEKKDEGIISSPSDVIRLVREVALGLLKKFYGYLRVDSFRVNVTVATDDPSKTAIAYGAICPTVYSFVEALYKHKPLLLPEMLF